MKRSRIYLGAAAFLVMLLVGLAKVGRGEQTVQGNEDCRAELVQVPEDTIVNLRIDDDFNATLENALLGSIRAMNKTPAAAGTKQGGISAQRLRQTLQALLVLVRKNLSKQQFLQQLRRQFNFFTFTGAEKENPMLITGYYEPQFKASLVRGAPYLYPLYAVPDGLLEFDDGATGRNRIYRRQGNMLFPYWRREEIDSGDLLTGSELVYLVDPLDAFVLHVQGSGRLRLPDGSLRRIRYAGNNGHPYKSIGRMLVEEGAMPLEEVSMPAIIDYLHDHPDQLRKILFHNDRYIFFAWDERQQSERLGPIGSMGEPLVPGRSVALDQRCYPLGAVGFLNARQPRFDEKGRLFSWVSLHRLVVNQDSGAAISGPFRLDLFCGTGPYAAKEAGIMRQHGDFFVLLKKTE